MYPLRVFGVLLPLSIPSRVALRERAVSRASAAAYRCSPPKKKGGINVILLHCDNSSHTKTSVPTTIILQRASALVVAASITMRQEYQDSGGKSMAAW